MIKYMAVLVIALVLLLPACNNSNTTSPVATTSTSPLDMSKIQGETRTIAETQKNIVGALNIFESGKGCPSPRIAKVEITQQPKETDGPWTERWTIDRCGTMVAYILVFTPDLKAGGAAFSIELEKKQSTLPTQAP